MSKTSSEAEQLAELRKLVIEFGGALKDQYEHKAGEAAERALQAERLRKSIEEAHKRDQEIEDLQARLAKIEQTQARNAAAVGVVTAAVTAAIAKFGGE